jgi:phosphoribosylanthranilate isomerase
MNTFVKVKVCCIQNIEEAKLAIKYGASALGFVSAMPSGPGVISEDAIENIISKIPPSIGTFLLTSKTDIRSIIMQQRKTKANTIQICDRLLKGTYKELKESLPGISIVQVIHIKDESSIEEAIKIAPKVHCLLLDSGNQSLKVKELGGTGRTHNWEISRKIVGSVDKPIFLSGGLTPENVIEAVDTVKPFGVDVCTGLRIDGKLNEKKLSKFIFNITNNYFQDLQINRTRKD